MLDLVDNQCTFKRKTLSNTHYQGAESTWFSGVNIRAGQNVNTPLKTLFLQISQVIEIHLKKS